ncbi:MAG: cupin domain-containing protein [Lachnospiraceae bacterium]|nr:cupin domain-containing protein [Lachnospiraceae bacterium]
MVKKSNELEKEYIENMHGGDGTIEITYFGKSPELNYRGKFFARVLVRPGCSIGFHTHNEDSEVIMVESGTLKYSDNGKEMMLCAGDVTICPSGTGHSMTNAGSDDLVLIATVIYAN